jgi:hypothetical protein
VTTTEHRPTHPDTLGLRAGDLVRVRPAEEVLATLDGRGELDALPFMPEMLAYCGRTMRVSKVAHKVCDNIARTGMRRMERAVHLADARCDGSAHGGCQNACQLHWKEAWLVRLDADARPSEPLVPASPPAGRPTLPLLVAATRGPAGPDGGERWSCQATEMLRATPTCLPFRELGQFREDVRTGNAGWTAVLRAFVIGLFNRVQLGSRKALPRRLWFRHGRTWGFLEGRVLRGRTPSGTLDLQPGELVRIRSKAEILDTVNGDLLNRGLGFDAEMSRFCGRVARVQRRVDRVIDERTGEMLTMKSPCIVLDGIFCEGAFTLSCPRAFVPFWREIWLERVAEPPY